MQSEGTLVKSDATFAGWNTAANESGTSHAAASTFAITADTVLHAQWTTSTPSITHTLTYDSNGGTGTSPKDAQHTSGSIVTVLASPSPTRSGYSFGGWSLTSTGVAVTSFTMPANIPTLYAKWMLTTFVPSWGTGNAKNTLSWIGI